MHLAYLADLKSPDSINVIVLSMHAFVNLIYACFYKNNKLSYLDKKRYYVITISISIYVITTTNFECIK